MLVQEGKAARPSWSNVAILGPSWSRIPCPTVLLNYGGGAPIGADKEQSQLNPHHEGLPKSSFCLVEGHSLDAKKNERKVVPYHNKETLQ